MKSAKITGAGVALDVSESPVPSPEGAQVLVRVRSAGVCHSDLHLWEGGYDMGDGKIMKVTDRGVRYPVVPGHEIAGTVERTGGDAGGYSSGDAVLVYPWIGCGACPACDAGRENVCDAPRSIGIFQDGGYAEYVLVPHHRYLARIGDLGMDEATSLACSGLTAYTAVKKASAGEPANIVVIGAGGLGLMGVQIARKITGAQVSCVDLDDEKLAAAKKAGAHLTFNSKEKDVASRIIEACGGKGAESVIDFVNAPPTAALGLEILRKRGTLVLVGLFGGSYEISLVTVPLKSITITGAYTGSYADMAELIELARTSSISPLISKKYALGEANAALEDLKSRRIVGRAVINP